MNYATRILCLLMLGVSVGCCRQRGDELHVLRMANPEYPGRAFANNIQGRVDLQVLIGADGKVIHAWVIGGADPILEEAAVSNVRTWEFGPFPPVAKFPIYDIITYEYRLEGPPLSVIQIPTFVYTHLPNRIEIVSRLFVNDLDEPKSLTRGTNPPGHAK